jgi:hypothetical protein
MMPPGHVAVTWGIASLLQKNKPRPVPLDYRLLAISGLLPDLIDKPLALLAFTGADTSQLIGHSLLFSLALVVVGLLWQQKMLPYVLAFSSHLLADRMWNHTETFWWPFFGWQTFWGYKPMNTPETMVSVYLDILTRYPQVWVVEIGALFFLLWFIYRHRLYRWQAARRFLRTGRLSPFTGTNWSSVKNCSSFARRNINEISSHPNFD